MFIIAYATSLRDPPRRCRRAFERFATVEELDREKLPSLLKLTTNDHFERLPGVRRSMYSLSVMDQPGTLQAVRKIWDYQLDAGRNLGKTNPLNDDAHADFVKLQKKRADSPKSWTVDAETIDPATFDLSVKNPNGGEAVAHRRSQEIMDEIAALDTESAAVLERIRGLL